MIRKLSNICDNDAAIGLAWVCQVFSSEYYIYYLILYSYLIVMLRLIQKTIIYAVFYALKRWSHINCKFWFALIEHLLFNFLNFDYLYNLRSKISYILHTFNLFMFSCCLFVCCFVLASALDIVKLELNLTRFYRRDLFCFFVLWLVFDCRCLLLTMRNCRCWLCFLCCCCCC